MLINTSLHDHRQQARQSVLIITMFFWRSRCTLFIRDRNHVGEQSSFLTLAHCHAYQLGRTHRSNEAVGPAYRLLVTNVGGESRFVSAAGLLVPTLP